MRFLLTSYLENYDLDIEYNRLLPVVEGGVASVLAGAS